MRGGRALPGVGPTPLFELSLPGAAPLTALEAARVLACCCLRLCILSRFGLAKPGRLRRLLRVRRLIRLRLGRG